MWKFIKKTIESLFCLPDNPKTKSFNIKLNETVYRVEQVRKSILYHDLQRKERLQIADEILYLIDDLNELSKIREKEMDRICQHFYITSRYPFISF